SREPACGESCDKNLIGSARCYCVKASGRTPNITKRLKLASMASTDKRVDLGQKALKALKQQRLTATRRQSHFACSDGGERATRAHRSHHEQQGELDHATAASKQRIQSTG